MGFREARFITSFCKGESSPQQKQHIPRKFRLHVLPVQQSLEFQRDTFRFPEDVWTLGGPLKQQESNDDRSSTVCNVRLHIVLGIFSEGITPPWHEFRLSEEPQTDESDEHSQRAFFCP